MRPEAADRPAVNAGVKRRHVESPCELREQLIESRPAQGGAGGVRQTRGRGGACAAKTTAVTSGSDAGTGAENAG